MWQDPQTPDRERKRMARLLIEDVTLIRAPEQVTAHIRYKGGAAETIHVSVRRRSTEPRGVAMAQRLQADQLDDSAPSRQPAPTTTDLRVSGGAV